jgi:hypothetical protein
MRAEDHHAPFFLAEGQPNFFFFCVFFTSSFLSSCLITSTASLLRFSLPLSSSSLGTRKMTDENTALITPPPGDDFLSPDVDGVWTKPEAANSNFNWGFFVVALLGNIFLPIMKPY